MNDESKKLLIEYRISRANETLKEVTILINNRLWNTAMSRLYYACFYAVNALFLKKGITATTHAGVRQMFGLHFIKTGIIPLGLGRFFSDIFDKRQVSDYDDFINFTEEEVNSQFVLASAFIQKIESLIQE